MTPLIRRTCALTLLFLLGLPCLSLFDDSPRPSPHVAEAQVAVYDAAAIIQAILHYIERLYEVYQKAVQIYNQYRELEYWYYAALQWDEIPFRDDFEVAMFLYDQAQAMKDTYRGYQALSWSLADIEEEFDHTFPGWKSLQYPLRFQTENGSVNLRNAYEAHRYQAHRVMGTVRNALELNNNVMESIRRASQEHKKLKNAADHSQGEEQTRQIQTAFQSHTADQLLELRGQFQILTDLTLIAQAREMDAEMQASARHGDSIRNTLRHIRSETGDSPTDIGPLRGGGWELFEDR